MEDPGYFAFLAKNQDSNYAHTKSAMAIKYFSDLYFEEQTKKNQDTSTSKFVGAEGGQFAGELKIYNIQVKDGEDFVTREPMQYKVYKMLDAEGNKFLANNLDKYFPQAQKDDTIKVKGKIKFHKELMGIKFNGLNYVRPA
jgi:hypothetical protein